MSSSNITLNGVHGTFKKNHSIILSKGFKPNLGRVGSGVYFWAESDFSYDLSVSWVKFRNSKLPIKNKDGTVIYVEMNINENECLVLDTALKLQVYNLMLKHDLDYKDIKQLSRAYDLIIKDIECITHSKFKVITGEVAPPPPDFIGGKYPKPVIGDPICYAVKDTNCINIKNYVDFKI